jgi:hypothetical protein
MQLACEKCDRAGLRRSLKTTTSSTPTSASSSIAPPAPSASSISSRIAARTMILRDSRKATRC